MREIRPSTWIILGVMTLLIFVPALFIDTGPPGNTIEPGLDHDVPPADAPLRPQVPDTPPANEPQEPHDEEEQTPGECAGEDAVD